MRKHFILLLAAISMVLQLAGCGSDNLAATETTIELKKNGSVVHTIVEAFAEEYYDLDELKSSIQSACDEYNELAGDGAVELGSTELQDGKLKVIMNYKSASAYAGFNKQALFAGTVQDAYNAGYDLNVTLLCADSEVGAVGKEELLEMGDKHMIIVREAVDVKAWDKVLYYSDDVIAREDDRTVMVTDSNSLTYIVFE